MQKKLWTILLSSLLLLQIGGICLGANQPGPPDQAKIEAELKKGLDQLVATNIITGEQEQTIIDYFKKPPQGQPGEKPSGPPPAMNRANQQPHNPLLDELVKKGVITEEQAKAVEKVLPKPPAMPTKGDGNNPPPAPPGP